MRHTRAMSLSLSLLYVFTFGFSLWLGLYLIARDVNDARLRYTGLGLIGYALSLVFDVLAQSATIPNLSATLFRFQTAFAFLPAVFWLGALLQLLPNEHRLRPRLSQLWLYSYLPLIAVLLLLGSSTPLLFDVSADGLHVNASIIFLAGLVLIPLLLIIGLLLREHGNVHQARVINLILVMTLFFALSFGLFLFALDMLPRQILLIGLAFDLEVLGLGIALLDTFEQGESLRADILRSFLASHIMVILFGTQIVIIMMLSTGVTFSMILLLSLVVASAIATQVFSNQLQALFDVLAFLGRPRLKKARADLRSAETALPRINKDLNLMTMEDAEFSRLTRRTLSHFGDLTRLAASPLTQIPLVGLRLAERGADDNTLERAQELKRVLTESILKLKPQDGQDFGASEAWRYYNVLYFPYIIGLRPFSQRADHSHLDSIAQEALEWFRTYVPERTYYNWQKAAAGLVAQDLREQTAKHFEAQEI